jgi:hypothetical protein
MGILELIDTPTDASDEDFDIQVDVFYDMKQKDEEQLSQDSEEGLLLASHQELVTAIVDKVICLAISFYRICVLCYVCVAMNK